MSDSRTAILRRLMVHVEPQVADQRFAFAAENIDPVPWRWCVVLDGITEVAGGQASFKTTAIAKGANARFALARRLAMQERTRRHVERHEQNGRSEASNANDRRPHTTVQSDRTDDPGVDR